jgi:hypothetical protein
VNARMRNMPATVVSSTLEGPLDWPNATLVSGDAVDVVARLKTEQADQARAATRRYVIPYRGTGCGWWR